MRALKILGIITGGLVALVIVLLLGVWLFVNPNDYKGRIARAVKESTGRELKLTGDIKLSVFPWVALELGPASLGNPQGFSDEPFAAVKHAALRVRLLPLLHKQLQIGRIEVEGLDLRLKKNASGKGNWEDFGQKNASPETSSGGGEALQDLAGVIVKDSRIGYQDLVVDHLNLDIGHIGTKSTVPFKASLDFIKAADAPPIHVDAKFDVTMDMAAKRYRFTPFEVNGSWTAKPSTAPVSWQFTAPDVSLDLAAQTVSVPNFGAQFAAARVQGSATGTKIVDAPSISGTFRLDPLVLREFMGRIGMTPPVTRDAKALSKLAASGDFTYGGDAVRAEKLDMQLDDSHLTGAAGITNLTSKAVSFDLAIDRIDIDRYRGPENAPPDPKPFELPSASLKALEANGTLTIGAARISGVNLTDVRVGIDSKGGVTHIAPAKAQLYGGQYSGDITLDDRTKEPKLTIDQTMTSIDVAQLLNDFAKTKRLSGRGNVAMKLAAHGRGGDTLIRSLAGRVDANLAGGAVEGIDLWYEINRAQALIKQQALPAGSSTGHTQFDSFKASADLSNGIATTKDLNVASQRLRVSGQGTSNLVSKAIDYDVKARILKAPPSASTTNLAALTLAEIPVKITGTMTSPQVRPDVQGIVKARVQQELDKHKDEIRQKVEDKLKDLLSR